MNGETQRHCVIVDVHLVLMDNGRVLLGRRQNTGFADGAYHLPAGHLEPGESVVEALIREAREETGIVIAHEAVQFAHVMHAASGAGRVAFFFTVDQWHGEPRNLEPHKCGELAWFQWNHLPDPIVPYARVALDHISRGAPMSVFGFKPG